MTEQNETESFTISAKLFERLTTAEYERGKRDGEATAKSLSLETVGYGSHVRALSVLYSDTKRGLSRLVKEQAWRRYGDNPGQAFAGDCTLLRATKTDEGKWEGICVFSTYYDV